MSKSAIRRMNQLSFLNSKEEIEVGSKEDLPLPVEVLKKIDQDSPWVEKVFQGLTTIVYKIKIDGKYYALKKKREKILVQGVDGQTSFLNEIQRRKDFESLKKTALELNEIIVETSYASLNHGFILLPWIRGQHISQLNKDIYENLFYSLYCMECNGFFEWDLSWGNMLLVNGSQIKLFDFGYTYLYNPLLEYNSLGKEKPVFHGVERFESRMFMTYLIDQEEKILEDKVLDEYKVEKEVALKYYIKKLRWLEKHRADDDIIAWTKGIIKLWEWGLRDNDSLKELYILESFRSYVVDVSADISGKSCSPMTIKKVNRVLELLNNEYDLLKENKGLFWGDELLSKQNLIDKYRRSKSRAEKYQLTIYNLL